MTGWVKLHRSLKDWGWYSDPACRSIFVHLLLVANHEPRQWLGEHVAEGQAIVGRQELGKTLGFGEQQIRTALTKLKSTNDITIKTTNKYSLITVVNWSKYQATNQQDNQQLTNNQPTTNQQLTTPKEVKKIRSKEDIAKPDSVRESVWHDFMILRKEKRAPVTNTVIDIIGSQALKAGITLDAALSECCARGWQSFKADWYKKTNNQSTNSIYAGVDYE